MISWLVRMPPDRAIRGRALAREIVLCSWGRRFFSNNASLHPGKWVPARLMLGVTLRWTASHPGGSSNAPSRFMFLLENSSGVSSLFI